MNGNKILVVYNTCGISGKDNSASYIKSLHSILDQDFAGFDLVMSSCLNDSSTRNSVMKALGSSVKYNFIDERHPVNVTFNHTIKKVVEERVNTKATCMLIPVVFSEIKQISSLRYIVYSPRINME